MNRIDARFEQLRRAGHAAFIPFFTAGDPGADVTVRLLRGAGAFCLCTGTHDQAVALLASEPLLDLAILDFQMPDGDVGRLVQRLHWLRPALPLVGTSASNRRSEFAAREVDRFLPKPWALDDLIQVADWPEAPGSQLPVYGP